MQIFTDYHGGDTNFAPLILPNGSMLALWRVWTGRGSRQFVATGKDWKDPSTYVRAAAHNLTDIAHSQRFERSASALWSSVLLT